MNVSISEKANFATVIRPVSKTAAESIIDFEGEAGTTAVRYNGNETTIWLSTGEDGLDALELKTAIANAVRLAVKLKRESVSIELTSAKDAGFITEAAILGAYQFNAYKSTKPVSLNDIELVGTVKDEDDIEIAQVIAESVNYARDLQNTNAGEIYPARLAEEAKEIVKESKLMKLTVLDEKDIEKEGLGLLKAVGQGSKTPPRLIFIEYTGDPESKQKVAVTGKGVTFDAGGMNLKPSGFIETMRLDMSGAAAALGTMKAIAALEPNINVIGVIPTCENAIGKDAYHTGDTYTSYDGTTVEVLNTDAEGRLILADAISYCKKNFAPTEIIDMVTLTGAILVGLGDTMAGLFSNDDDLTDNLFASGESCGDRLWMLPIRKEHEDALKSDIADIRNISKIKRKAGSITAATFLKHFAGDTPWAHIDIAGTAWNDGEASGTNPKFGTGFGVRLMLEYLLK